MKLQRNFVIEVSITDQVRCSSLCQFHGKDECILFGRELINKIEKEPIRCVPCLAYFKSLDQVRIYTKRTEIQKCSEKIVGSSMALTSGSTM